uniref:Uncharacterized protein n=1 Tax=Cannabis sativa TaxID=3483 RepID=A0A803PZB7_CANSA
MCIGQLATFGDCPVCELSPLAGQLVVRLGSCQCLCISIFARDSDIRMNLLQNLKDVDRGYQWLSNTNDATMSKIGGYTKSYFIAYDIKEYGLYPFGESVEAPNNPREELRNTLVKKKKTKGKRPATEKENSKFDDEVSLADIAQIETRRDQALPRCLARGGTISDALVLIMHEGQKLVSPAQPTPIGKGKGKAVVTEGSSNESSSKDEGPLDGYPWVVLTQKISLVMWTSMFDTWHEGCHHRVE